MRLVKDETTRRNPDQNSGIYLTADIVAQYRLVAENRREKGEAKRKYQRIHPTKSCFFNKSDMNISEMPRPHEQSTIVSQ